MKVKNAVSGGGPSNVLAKITGVTWKRRDKEITKHLADILVVVESRRYNKIPGFSPVLGTPLGCFRISLPRSFIPPRLSDEHSTFPDYLKSTRTLPV